MQQIRMRLQKGICWRDSCNYRQKVSAEGGGSEAGIGVNQGYFGPNLVYNIQWWRNHSLPGSKVNFFLHFAFWLLHVIAHYFSFCCKFCEIHHPSYLELLDTSLHLRMKEKYKRREGAHSTAVFRVSKVHAAWAFSRYDKRMKDTVVFFASTLSTLYSRHIYSML
jgi:hypothetical protein